MKKYILFLAMLLALCFMLTGCDNGGSGGNTYTVSFEANGGSGSMTPVSVSKGESYTIPASTFTEPKIPTGAVNEGADIPFREWNTKADGTGDKYVAGASIPAVSADVTLYAQWAKPVFSVSDTKKVYFAKGNLYWDGSSFKMENTQFVITPTSSGAWEENHVSHFYWSKDAEKAYAETYSDSGASTDTFFAANGGAIDGWDVLSGGSSGEWYYLFNTRTDAASKVGYGTVCGVEGIILLPDVFTDPMKNNGTEEFKPKITPEWDANVYTYNNWAAMEAAGAVFLPAAGYRIGSFVSLVGSYGFYWSATPDENFPFNAYSLYFNSSGMGPDYDDQRYYGYSVRLVCGE